MADGKIKISELDGALQLADNAKFPYVQEVQGEDVTLGAEITQMATKINEGITYSNLKTGSKQTVNAINETLSNFADYFDIVSGSTYAEGDCVVYQGVLYQCTNQSGTTSGTFITEDWTSIKAVDVGSGGGGGSGGHTILNDAGTSLTQRNDLQFKGTYSEDDSTNSKTVVNIARSMTRSQFDLLSADEKKGFINITDETSGGDDKFQPVIYSEDEHEIGVWIDGKPLYQKTVNLTNITIAVSGGYSYDISSWNVDTVVKNPEGFITHDTDFRTVPFGVLGSYAADITSTKSAVQFSRKGGDLFCNRAVFTLTYTKTTDTAGSGQWTPQGVPAVHYSADEKVIGTWVDGSTLYEKTIDFGSDLTVSYNAWTETTEDCSTVGRYVYGEGCSNGGTYSGTVLCSKKANNKLEIQTPRNSNTQAVRYLTVRYTKSST